MINHHHHAIIHFPLESMIFDEINKQNIHDTSPPSHRYPLPLELMIFSGISEKYKHDTPLRSNWYHFPLDTMIFYKDKRAVHTWYITTITPISISPWIDDFWWDKQAVHTLPPISISPSPRFLPNSPLATTNRFFVFPCGWRVKIWDSEAWY